MLWEIKHVVGGASRGIVMTLKLCIQFIYTEKNA